MDQIWSTTSYYRSNSALILWSAGSQRRITSDRLLRLQNEKARRSLDGVLLDGAERRQRLPWKAARSFWQLTGAIRFGSADIKRGKVIGVVKRPLQISMLPLIEINAITRGDDRS
jgi:hypothetical protein